MNAQVAACLVQYCLNSIAFSTLGHSDLAASGVMFKSWGTQHTPAYPVDGGQTATKQQIDDMGT